jgi:hypothetical protein
VHKIIVRKPEGKRFLDKWEDNRDMPTQVFEPEQTGTLHTHSS